MKNILSSLIAIILLGFLASGAQAYSVGFDPDGNSTNPADNTQTYFQWNLTPTVGTNYEYSDGSTTPGSAGGQLWTEQNISTGNFTETFTVELDKGFYDTDGTYGTTDFTNTFIEITLNGRYVDDNEINFTSGSSTIYNSTDTIAELELSSALTTSLDGSLLGNGIEMSINLSFLFTDLNDAYWSEEMESLVALNWIFTMTSGNINQESIMEDDQEGNITEAGTITDPDEDDIYVIEWSLDGIATSFTVVPEPTTFALFGLGLLSLAGIVRRKN
jgi:hypothetical protein